AEGLGSGCGPVEELEELWLEELDEEESDQAADQGPSEWRRWCRDEAREDKDRERCREALSDFGAMREGRWVSFRVDAANATLLDYRVDGLLVAESIHLETGSDNLTVQASGSALRIGDEDTELVLHDDPTGLIRLKGDDGSLTIQIPAGAQVQHAADGSVARITYPDGRIGHLRSDNATFLDDHTVVASGFLALLVPHERQEPQGQQDQQDDGERADREEKVNDAIEDRKIGAEITLRAPQTAAAAAAALAGTGNGSVEVLAYDDVEVQVQLPASGVASPEAPIRIELSADLDEGRTIVLNVNRSLLESDDADSLVLAYFDLFDQPDGSTLETEVVFRQASSLQDVLDPTDDGGSPEYWVVEDANGLQVLASVPHWSAHAITVSSLAGLSSPSVVTGLVVGVAGSLVAAAMLFWPRRPEDE
ncbi:MAG: hypothetical protein QOC71_753, partial [Thermoplasmata archaeon]|nr:hypothetical protein [Thermoplasmata archaeon]